MDATDDGVRLELGLERAAMLALGEAYDDLNQAFFAGRLRRPTLELSTAAGSLGSWDGSTRTLQLQRALLLRERWGRVIEVLKHEMAHQFVDEILGAGGEPPHGPCFRRVCAERAIDASASGTPADAGGDAPHPMVDRIAKLLALAQSDNEHEAQAAMSAAQRLMLRYNLDVIETGQLRGYTFRHLGTPTGRVEESQRMLAGILTEYFFVEAIWVPVWRPREAKRGSVLEVCGTRENVEMAEYVHSFLNRTALALFREFQRRMATRRNAERRRFCAGVMVGFRERLQSERATAAECGLVWVQDAELVRFLRRRHPHVRWTRHSSSTSSEAYSEGRAQGRRIVLHRGVEQGPTERRRRLLPSPRS